MEISDPIYQFYMGKKFNKTTSFDFSISYFYFQLIWGRGSKRFQGVLVVFLIKYHDACALN